MATPNIVIVVPNWNGKKDLKACLDSLKAQALSGHIIVVDNGSIDGSANFVAENYPDVELIRHEKNLGYAGGVNPGFKRARELGASYAAPFNNDAVAEKDWLYGLVEFLEANPEFGIATPKIMSADGSHIDSTGDYYTAWGLPYPRGRGEPADDKYDQQTVVFGASGGASLYRVAMLDEIGLLDEDFFAYYEDVDLSFRAQLAGWKVAYVPTSHVNHQMNITGAKIKGFFAEQTFKNLPMLLWKNVPRSLLPTILPRFTLVYATFWFSALARGQAWYAFKGWLRMLTLLPKKFGERRSIQKNRKVNDEYVRSILTWDLPPNAARLRRLRGFWWKLRGNRA